MSVLASTFRWFQRKRYQYEVTFSLYMMTPAEKFIFNSFIFLFFSMILIGTCLYLPQHISFLITRAWFYYQGDPEAAKDAVVATISSTAGDRFRDVIETARAAAKVASASSAVSAASEAVKEL